MTPTQRMAAQAREYRRLCAAAREMEEQAETIRAIMIAEMDAMRLDTLRAGEYTVRYAPYQQSRLDAAALQSELPDIAARYTKDITALRFQVV